MAELKSGQWAKTYEKLGNEVIKNTKSLNLDKKLLWAIEANNPVINKLKDIDKLINGFAMARDANKGPFLEPYKKAVKAGDEAHKKYIKALDKAVKDFGPTVKVHQTTFNKAFKAYKASITEMADQPASQIAGMEQEIKAAGQLDKKAETALKAARKDHKKLSAPFADFRKLHERAMEDDIAAEKKHTIAQRKLQAQWISETKKYEAAKKTFLNNKKEPTDKAELDKMTKEIGDPPPEKFEEEPYAAVFNKNYVEDFNDSLDKLVDDVIEPLLLLEKSMKKKGLDMGKEFPKVVADLKGFAGRNTLKLGDGRKGVTKVLSNGSALFANLGPAVKKIPEKAKK